MTKINISSISDEIVSLKVCIIIFAGNSDSGTWSNSGAILLGGIASLRFIKLEVRSPRMA